MKPFAPVLVTDAPVTIVPFPVAPLMWFAMSNWVIPATAHPNASRLVAPPLNVVVTVVTEPPGLSRYQMSPRKVVFDEHAAVPLLFASVKEFPAPQVAPSVQIFVMVRLFWFAVAMMMGIPAGTAGVKTQVIVVALAAIVFSQVFVTKGSSVAPGAWKPATTPV